MSIETFTAAYPADSQFAVYVARRPEYGLHSPVHTMADIYIREGAAGMREAIGKISAAESTRNIKQIRKTFESVILNSYGILLGATVISIEEMIAEHTFDQVGFNARLEAAFMGCGLIPGTIEDPVVEDIDEKSVREIIEVAKNDKTFGDFFKSGFGTLPSSLRTFLITGRMPEVIDSLLPGYITRTSLLISARNQARNGIT